MEVLRQERRQDHVASVAKLLSDFPIIPRTVRLNEGTTRTGYLREQFVDAFERYLEPVSPEGGSVPRTPTQSSDINDLEPNLSHTNGPHVWDKSEPNSLENNNCVRVWDTEPPRPEGDLLRSMSASEGRSAEDAVKALENRGFVVSCPLNGPIVFADRRAKPGERPRTPPQPLMNAVYDNADAVAQFLSRREKERGF